MLDIAETPELTGHLIWALFNDPALMEKSGQTWIGAELAREYGIEDDDGRQAPVIPRPLRNPPDAAIQPRPAVTKSVMRAASTQRATA